MTYTDEQIELFDKVFDYCINFYIHRTERANPTDRYLSKKLSIDKSLAQFAINEVCTIGHDLHILTAQKFAYGASEIVQMDKVKSLTFQSQGGFKKYFIDIDTTLNTNKNIHIGDNYGQVINTGNQSSFSDLDFKKVKKTPNTTPTNIQTQPYQNTLLFIVSWIFKNIFLVIIITLFCSYLVHIFGWTK